MRKSNPTCFLTNFLQARKNFCCVFSSLLAAHSDTTSSRLLFSSATAASATKVACMAVTYIPQKSHVTMLNTIVMTLLRLK